MTRSRFFFPAPVSSAPLLFVVWSHAYFAICPPQSAFKADARQWKRDSESTQTVNERIATALDLTASAPKLLNSKLAGAESIRVALEHEDEQANFGDTDTQIDDEDDEVEEEDDSHVSILRQRHSKVSRCTTFFIGLSLGLTLAVLSILAVLLNLSSSASSLPAWLAAFPVFRGLIIFIFEIWCFGMVRWVQISHATSHLKFS